MALLNIEILRICLLVLVVTTFLAEATRNCTPRSMPVKRKFQHLRQHYHFVEKIEIAEAVEGIQIPRRTKRSASSASNSLSDNKTGSSLCPWRWVNDDDTTRSPRYFRKAECPGCAHYCRAVYYHHRALFKRCDSTTGMRVWKWIEIALPIAFLYDP
ncbi:uncharacterized protein LOC116292432 [Actinia tenebrosa]|uniref:Uncharacterized protein LOC116292432 n=1 Tax=Actinia tenebrosa TaxID=6105 RepID=A0A6P8HL22_ACTTE|nr:uncharacterized protein LOC116292432 [Actinia tenebrosa]